MDADRFDHVSRVAAGLSRRHVGRGLASLGLLWGLGRWDGTDEVTAKRKSKRKKKAKKRKKKAQSQSPPPPVSCAVGQVFCGSACFPECCPGSTRACYTGPTGTRNVGVCRDGEQYCQATGTWSSVCGGQVTPSIEVCNGLDDDCDGVVDEGADVVLCNSESFVCEDARCCKPAGGSCTFNNDAVCCSNNCDEVILNVWVCQ
jgi:hypothetical protein